jgi:prepilin-type N-terminal cleavage/methylation domain-containing protein
MFRAIRRAQQQPKGFTLIELLVVIGVIAILIGLLLPSVSRARKSGWLVKSLSNMRSIMTANFTYQNDQKGFSAFGPLRGSTGTPAGRGMVREAPPSQTQEQVQGTSSWVFGGKESDGQWAAALSGGAFDYESTDRPLNRWMNDQIFYPYQDQPTVRVPATADIRRDFQLDYFKDPSDRFSLQEHWSYNAQSINVGRLRYSTALFDGRIISSYDDVGTSYHMNFKWLDGITNGGFWDTRTLFRGMRFFRTAEGINPSKFAFIYDQFTDVISNSDTNQYQIVNGYGDRNKSVMGFFDGHAGYVTVRPGGGSAISNPEAFSNSDYTLYISGRNQ